ncbi:hypothetical protein ACIVBQ_000694 [Tenacibaculum discolor]
MKKSILELGKSVSKTEQKQINGGDYRCPPLGCYYSDEPIPNTPATYCGNCQDYNNLPLDCKSKVFAHADCES